MRQPRVVMSPGEGPRTQAELWEKIYPEMRCALCDANDQLAYNSLVVPLRNQGEQMYPAYSVLIDPESDPQAARAAGVPKGQLLMACKKEEYEYFLHRRLSRANSDNPASPRQGTARDIRGSVGVGDKAVLMVEQNSQGSPLYEKDSPSRQDD